MRVLALLVVLAVGASTACTRTYNVPRPHTAAELEITTMRQSGGVVTPIVAAPTARATAASPELVPWGNELTPRGEIPMVDLSQVGGYEVRRRGKGALEGFVLGTVGGALAGFLVGSSLGSDHCTPSDSNLCFFELSATEKGTIGAVLAGMTGAVLGTIVGGVRGHTDRYVFQF